MIKINILKNKVDIIKLTIQKTKTYQITFKSAVE